MNYQKIHRTSTHKIREHWTAVSTLLSLISSVYRNLHHWRSNQRPQCRNSTTEPPVNISQKWWRKSTDVTCKTHLVHLSSVPVYRAYVFGRFSGHGNSIIIFSVDLLPIYFFIFKKKFGWFSFLFLCQVFLDSHSSVVNHSSWSFELLDDVSTHDFVLLLKGPTVLMSVKEGIMHAWLP